MTLSTAFSVLIYGMSKFYLELPSLWVLPVWGENDPEYCLVDSSAVRDTYLYWWVCLFVGWYGRRGKAFCRLIINQLTIQKGIKIIPLTGLRIICLMSYDAQSLLSLTCMRTSRVKSAYFKAFLCINTNAILPTYMDLQKSISVNCRSRPYQYS